ncbi:unnamed protein product, partial [Discosporangium mesarthrocarpum]
MDKPALFVGDADGGETLDEDEVRERMLQGLPPESAEEYLIRVRIESRDLPGVVEAFVPESVKKEQTSYMPRTEPVPTCPEFLLPREEWQRDVLATFVDLRQYIRYWKARGVGSKTAGGRLPVPALKDRVGWHIFCVGCADGADDEEDKGAEEGRFSIAGSGGTFQSGKEAESPRKEPDSAGAGTGVEAGAGVVAGVRTRAQAGLSVGMGGEEAGPEGCSTCIGKAVNVSREQGQQGGEEGGE